MTSAAVACCARGEGKQSGIYQTVPSSEFRVLSSESKHAARSPERHNSELGIRNSELLLWHPLALTADILLPCALVPNSGVLSEGRRSHDGRYSESARSGDERAGTTEAR